ncbi:hypothetical protein [Hahella ganghwensis]|uniref:hypothetical protein n=1 Tax=Hahella ganghwensis TaxID=286420 RepID=UPI000365DDDC|nr:hypothetical protein [Hahella ganghwensis]
MMKRICQILLIVASGHLHADCLKDSNGDVYCGPGSCEITSTGQIFCASNKNGGILKNQYGEVVCGVGHCAKNSNGEVYCSKEIDGGAAANSNGEVMCYRGCNVGSQALCVREKGYK